MFVQNLKSLLFRIDKALLTFCITHFPPLPKACRVFPQKKNFSQLFPDPTTAARHYTTLFFASAVGSNYHVRERRREEKNLQYVCAGCVGINKPFFVGSQIMHASLSPPSLLLLVPRIATDGT